MLVVDGAIIPGGLWCPRLDQLLVIAAQVQAVRRDRWAFEDGYLRFQQIQRRAGDPLWWLFGEAHYEDTDGPDLGPPGYGNIPERAVHAWLLAVAKERVATT